MVGNHLAVVGTVYKQAHKMSTRPKRQFYKRTLPDTCTAFNSEEGKRLFKESLLAGYANIYFPLAEQFRTQSEPAYCGLSTLVMVLNTLAVDPKKIWRGGWRWYHEEMLDCCLPLDVIQQDGITMDQFTCLATCNSLDLNVTRLNEKVTIDEFRETVKTLCAGEGRVLVCSYSRRCLGQTGDGHFSPIGAYHPADDKLLIFDVARFKYPPHWVTIQQMWDAMKAVDKATELPRGFIIMKKTKESPLILFRLSNTFRVTIATHNLQKSNMAKFLISWKNFFENTKYSEENFSDIKSITTFVLNALNESLSSLMESESVFTTQFNTCCTEALPTEHLENVRNLLKDIEKTNIYKYTYEWIQNFKSNNTEPDDDAFSCENPVNENCSRPNGCRIHRIGKSIAEKKNSSHIENLKTKNGIVKEIEVCNTKESNKPIGCNHKTTGCIPKTQPISVSHPDHSEENLVTDSHYITMLLLSWPYEMELSSQCAVVLNQKVQNHLSNASEILVNEVKQLHAQIGSLLSMISNKN